MAQEEQQMVRLTGLVICIWNLFNSQNYLTLWFVIFRTLCVYVCTMLFAIQYLLCLYLLNLSIPFCRCQRGRNVVLDTNSLCRNIFRGSIVYTQLSSIKKGENVETYVLIHDIRSTKSMYTTQAKITRLLYQVISSYVYQLVIFMLKSILKCVIKFRKTLTYFKTIHYTVLQQSVD